MSKVVLDASAVLALLNLERGSEEVIKNLETGVISSVNFSEVIAKLAESGVTEEAILGILGDLDLEIIYFDRNQAVIAGMLRPVTKPLGLSFGDRACLALGLSLNLGVLTADQSWSNLDIGVNIFLIR